MEGGNAAPNFKMTDKIFDIIMKLTKTKTELKISDAEICSGEWRRLTRFIFRCGSKCRVLYYILLDKRKQRIMSTSYHAVKVVSIYD